MPITGAGWELLVQRIGLHQSGGQIRTYGSYQAYLNGQPIAQLSGNVCESPGPGENQFPASKENPRRIEQGRYPLWTQFGTNYCTIGYETNLTVPGQTPMPGVLLGNTVNRTAILIHPGHPPDLFLSSIGCLNLTKQLQPQENMDFVESRSRVIAVINDLANFTSAAFQQNREQQIPNAWIVIDGEPMNILPAGTNADV